MTVKLVSDNYGSISLVPGEKIIETMIKALLIVPGDWPTPL